MSPGGASEALRLVARKRVQIDQFGRLHAIPFVHVDLDDKLVVVRSLAPVHPANLDVRQEELGTTSHRLCEGVDAQDEVGCAYRVDGEDGAGRMYLGDGQISHFLTYFDKRAGNATYLALHQMYPGSRRKDTYDRMSQQYASNACKPNRYYVQWFQNNSRLIQNSFLTTDDEIEEATTAYFH